VSALDESRTCPIVNAASALAPQADAWTRYIQALPLIIREQPNCGRDLVKRFRRLGGDEALCPVRRSDFPWREEGLKQWRDTNAKAAGPKTT
jgi:hypothetical protein